LVLFAKSVRPERFELVDDGLSFGTGRRVVRGGTVLHALPVVMEPTAEGGSGLELVGLLKIHRHFLQ
jgi:hypothetical protein